MIDTTDARVIAILQAARDGGLTIQETVDQLNRLEDEQSC